MPDDQVAFASGRPDSGRGREPAGISALSLVALRDLALLGRMKWRHLRNFLTAQGSSWQTLFRWLGLFLWLSFLRFVTFNIAETFRAARTPEQILFLAAGALLASGLMLLVFNLLVFVSDEFQVGTDANDFEFLLTLPVGFPTVVWAKVLLRALFDLVGLSLMGPTLVALAMHFGLAWWAWPALYAIYFGVEVLAGLASVLLFFAAAQFVSLGRLETLRLLAGFAVPFAAAMLLGAKSRLTDPDQLAALLAIWEGPMRLLPSWWAVAGLSEAQAGPGLGAASVAFLALAGAMHAGLARMQHLATSLSADQGAGRVAPVWGRLFAAARTPWAALAVKDLAMMVRRRVTFITVALMPLGIVAVNVLTISAGSAQRQGISPEILTLTSMAIPLLFLPYMTAAQSLGQIEYSRISFLQALPIGARRILQVKALFWTPPVFLLAEVVHLTFLVQYGRFRWVPFATESAWILAASLLVTHLAVATAAMFPVSENALFKQQGATLTVSSLVYLTGSLGAVALVFPLRLPNRLALLAVTGLLVHFVLVKAAQRLEYFDEARLLSPEPGLRFGEAFILFDAYICLYLLTTAAIALLPEVGRTVQLLLMTGALLGSQVALAAASSGYLRLKGYSLGAAWAGAWSRGRSLALGPVLGGLAAAPFVLARLNAAGGNEAARALLGQEAGPLLGGLFLFAALVSGPVCEEIFFRGLFTRAFVAATGRPLAGLAVGGLFFALPHYFLSGQFWPPLTLGLLCGALFAAGGGLRSAVLAHLGFNTLSLVLSLPAGWPVAASAALAVCCGAAVAGWGGTAGGVLGIRSRDSYRMEV